eukprot:CAMPEP_0184683168 /NCGR_PEP_ID=MMETSP0312-20130426/10142_1 /TAXON_ID=31354 /ORGANISM="Compsopogon coeruleus, Strain SAG 36.94" /LENGTH=49 /DNA_ID=CAMNT_0027135287 /DNA_START=68 /DNA_END=217 /DNA_ORIENTATION=-
MASWTSSGPGSGTAIDSTRRSRMPCNTAAVTVVVAMIGESQPPERIPQD